MLTIFDGSSEGNYFFRFENFEYLIQEEMTHERGVDYVCHDLLRLKKVKRESLSIFFVAFLKEITFDFTWCHSYK